ncbi:Uncharacterized protein SCG7109_AD_00110 [Chlamydiales bacterium SCGC AG-110-M15]|nr:Uncharacterized protein SCG7109_AD_00110 [Chlamydiales bacterium SCGC AG-110-M15]
MKKTVSAALAALFMLSGGNAFAASVKGSAVAEVLTPIAIAQVEDMSFGTFTAGTNGGTVSASGGSTGSITHLGGSKMGSFSASGEDNMGFRITLDDSTVLAGPGADMPALLNGPAEGQFDGTGTASFDVDGLLTVGASQAPGSYRGTYMVSIDY